MCGHKAVVGGEAPFLGVAGQGAGAADGGLAGVEETIAMDTGEKYMSKNRFTGSNRMFSNRFDPDTLFHGS